MVSLLDGRADEYKISDCFPLGLVSFAASYSTGRMTPSSGGAHVGGLTGEVRNCASSVTNSYWNTLSSGVVSDGQG